METSPRTTITRKIILFSDGTGNSSAKAQKTNVWRFFQAIDQTQTDQIAEYDDGVGTSSIKVLAVMGGAFGYGLKRNVINLYKFVCRNYAHGDDIYGFGFSRGAFTIRVLIGLIAREGLVTFRSDEELDRNAAAAYRSFRRKAFQTKSPIIWLFRKLRDGVLALRDSIKRHAGYDRISAETKVAQRDQIPIRFLGLWDTVEAYGMPIAELKRGIDWLLWPMLFGDMKLAPTVKRAVHALSLDDERTTFHPLLWDEQHEAELMAENTASAGRITQVWFVGVHSNVGGGYPEDQLSMVPLEWMIAEAASNGLRVDSNRIAQYAVAKSPYARLYDSRAGLAAYYRYAPRQTPIVNFRGKPILANIHWTVLMRMVYGSDSYAPITLPHAFNVLTPDGRLLDIHQLRHALKTCAASATGSAELDSVIQALGSPNHDEVGLVWDTVFWRRCLYFATMAMTLAAVAYPWSHLLVPQRLSDLEKAASGPIGTVVNSFSGMIPSYLGPWKRALINDPLVFGLLLIGIAITLLGSQGLERRIHDRARLVWHRGPVGPYRQWREEGRIGLRRAVIVGLVLFAAGTVVSLWVGKSNLSLDLGLSALLLAMGYAISVIGFRQNTSSSQTRVRGTLALRIAREIRENKALIWIYTGVTQYVIPLIFAAMLVVAGALFANRAIFDTVSSAGRYCKGALTEDPDNILEKLGVGTANDGASAHVFTTDSMCWASGLVLKKDHRYLITITMGSANSNDRWFDRDAPTDVIGFPTDSARHWFARPLTRWWSENWFKPIARIGQLGNDEYVLDPIDKDVAVAKPPACLDGLHLPARLPIRTKIDCNLATSINQCAPPTHRVLYSEITARSSGELFIYVNDAITAIPGIEKLFFSNNSGTASVRVQPFTFSSRTLGREVQEVNGLKVQDNSAFQAAACPKND